MRRALALGVVLLSAAACGGGGENEASPSSVPSSATQTSIALTCHNDLSAGPVFTLVMQNLMFHPSCFNARSEQGIHIVNKDSVLHNFTIPGTIVDVDVQPGKFFNGESAGLKPGTYPFFCKYHKSSGMTGTVVVK